MAHKSYRVALKCGSCGKDYIRQRSKAVGSRFCNERCRWNNNVTWVKPIGKKSEHLSWRGGKIEVSCALCGKTCFRKRYLLKVRKNFFCSCRCNTIYNLKHAKTKETNIERMMESFLIKNNYEYVKQFAIGNLTVVDFYLPKENIIIYCDGDYWHNYPVGKPFDVIQKKRLEEMGYVVYRIWERDILNLEL